MEVKISQMSSGVGRVLPVEKQTALRFFRHLQPLVGNGEKGAGKLAQTLLTLWQRKSFQSLAGPHPHVPAELAKNPQVTKFVDWLSSLDVLTGAFWLSSAYARWVGEDMRTERAMFFTPPILSSRLIENLIANGASLTTNTWLDPASGGAAFLAPVALRMSEALRAQGRSSAEILTHVAEHLTGNDIDPCLADMSKQFLRMALYADIQQAGDEPEFKVTALNALEALAQARSDVIICNPPYRKMPSAEVATYRERYGEVIVGQPNLYALFFKLALDTLNPNGIAGLLTPTSYLSGHYFSQLRRYMRMHAEIPQLDIISATGAFVGVDQETAITIMARHDTPRTNRATKVFISASGNGLVKAGACHLPTSDRPWAIPRDSGDSTLLNAASSSTARLSDYGYSAKVGAFVWNRDTRKTYSRDPKLKSGGTFPLVWSSNIGTNGKFALRPGEPGQYVKMGTENIGSVIRRPCVALQRVTSSDQAKRLIGAAIPQSIFREYEGIVGENHVVFLEQTTSSPVVSPSLLAEILRTKTIDRLFRCISGAVNVSVYELNHLPLPEPGNLLEALARTSSVDAAVNAAFSLPS
jgi:adenine-specific DNA-methyltransferase